MKNSFSRVKGNAPYDFLKSDVFSCFFPRIKYIIGNTQNNFNP